MTTGPTGFALSKDGLKIAYEKSGRGSPAIVFVHGWCGNRSHWINQVPFFSGSHTVVTIDLPGYGASGTRRKNWSIEGFAGDVNAVIEHLALKDVILVGHSMSGRVIAEAASRMKNPPRGVVGVEALWNVDAIPSPDFIKKDMQTWRGQFEERARNYVGEMFIGDGPPGLKDRITREVLANDREAAIGGIRAIYDNDPRGALQALQEAQVPVHLVNAPHWRPTNFEAAARYGIRVDLIEGSGHYLMMEKPDALNGKLASIFGTFIPGRSPAVLAAGQRPGLTS